MNCLLTLTGDRELRSVFDHAVLLTTEVRRQGDEQLISRRLAGFVREA
jgi:hypothetical protein